MSSSDNTKQPRLTKKGLPDKRGQTSAQNLAKGKSIIKEALKIAKEKQEVKPKLEVVYSSDEYSTDEEEIELKDVKVSSVSVENTKPIDIPKLERKETEDIKPKPHPESLQSVARGRNSDDEGTKSEAEHYTFTFEKKLEEKIKELNDMYGIKISNIENETKLTKAELKAIKEQNQALKKSMTNNFRTHAGIINEEMYLKF